MRTIALLATLILCTACGTSGSAPTDACGPWRPIYVGKADVLTADTARALLAHNRTWRALCEAP